MQKTRLQKRGKKCESIMNFKIYISTKLRLGSQASMGGKAMTLEK